VTAGGTGSFGAVKCSSLVTPAITLNGVDLATTLAAQSNALAGAQTTSGYVNQNLFALNNIMSAPSDAVIPGFPIDLISWSSVNDATVATDTPISFQGNVTNQVQKITFNSSASYVKQSFSCNLPAGTYFTVKVFVKLGTADGFTMSVTDGYNPLQFYTWQNGISTFAKVGLWPTVSQSLSLGLPSFTIMIGPGATTTTSFHQSPGSIYVYGWQAIVENKSINFASDLSVDTSVRASSGSFLGSLNVGGTGSFGALSVGGTASFGSVATPALKLNGTDLSATLAAQANQINLVSGIANSAQTAASAATTALETFTLGNSSFSTLTATGPITFTLGNYPNDAVASANGVPLNGMYRTDNVVKILAASPPVVYDTTSGVLYNTALNMNALSSAANWYLEGWIYVTSLTGAPFGVPLVDFRQLHSNNRYQFSAAIDTSNNNELLLYSNGGISGGVGYDNSSIWFGTVSLPLNTWLHFAYQKTPSGITGFFNGVKLQTSTNISWISNLSDMNTVQLGSNSNHFLESGFVPGILRSGVKVGTTLKYTTNFTPSYSNTVQSGTLFQLGDNFTDLVSGSVMTTYGTVTKSYASSIP
jgi:hypothetical protein